MVSSSPSSRCSSFPVKNSGVAFRGLAESDSAISFWSPATKSVYDSSVTTVCSLMSWTVTGLSMRSPCWSTAMRSPRPISWRRETVLSLFLSMPIVKTLGLSQPSRSAEWEKMNRTGSSNESRRSLSFSIRSYASASVEWPLSSPRPEDLGVDKLLGLLVDREVALVNGRSVVALEVLLVCRSRSVEC